MRGRIALVVLVAVPWLAPLTPAQLPPATRYVASAFGTYMTAGNALVGFDGSGAITTVVPLVAPNTAPSAIGMAPTNDAILVWDVAGVHRHDITTGTTVFTSLLAGGGTIHWGALDEDGGLIWCIGAGPTQGDVYKSLDTAGSFTTRLGQLPLQNLNAVCWIGATGEYALAQYAVPGGNVYVMGRDGTILRAIPNLLEVSGLDWSPWDLRVYASNFGLGSRTGIYALDLAASRATPLGPVGPLSDTNNSIAVLHQPSSRLLCAEFGNSPQHLWTFDPATSTVTTIHASSGQVGFSGAAAVRDRPLWATALWSVGGRGDLSVNFGPARAGDLYQVALSLAVQPGIPVPPIGRIHLAPDGLLRASLSLGPPVFHHFAGRLDFQGRAWPPPFVLLPVIPALQGLRVFGAAVAYDSHGIQEISNAWGTTIQ